MPLYAVALLMRVVPARKMSRIYCLQTNYLVSAGNAKAAFERVKRVGLSQERKPGNDVQLFTQKASWKYGGIRNVSTFEDESLSINGLFGELSYEWLTFRSIRDFRAYSSDRSTAVIVGPFEKPKED